MNELIDTFSNRLNKAILLRNIKPIELSKKTGIDKSKISSYMSGRYKAKQDGIYLLAEALNVSEAWLMGLDVPMDRNIKSPVSNSIEALKVPVLGKISAGVPILAEESFEGYALAPAIDIKKGRKYFYLRVNGDSMNLKFPEGSIILVEKTTELSNGDIGIIAINGYEATIKKYRRENNLVILEPMSNNPIHNVQIYDITNTPIHIIGKAISYQGKV